MKRSITFFSMSFFITILFCSVILFGEEGAVDCWTYDGVTYRLPIPRDQVVYPPDLPKVYIVKEKDTLWDISGAFLKNPFFWPLIWEVNPEVKNPHLIFPQDEIKFMKASEAKTEEKVEEPVVAEKPQKQVKKHVEGKKKEVTKEKPEKKKESYSTYDVYQSYFASGLISDKKSGKDVIAQGKIISAPFEHGTITINSRVYVDAQGCQKDSIYKIFRIGDKVKHPKTKKVMGRMVYTLGYLQIVCEDSQCSEGIITKAYDEIQIGNKIILCSKDEFQLEEEPTWQDCFKLGSGLKGTIISTQNHFDIFSDLDIIYLDVGNIHGVKTGDYFAVIIKSGNKNIKIYNQIAQLVILKTQNNTSSAVITKSIFELHVGDTVELL
ncbi:LysM peptidoglycan-binding domain-containing protein [bacterium]|nr:LysM peptidoglycan-binding domain-containing protein [bacterium]